VSCENFDATRISFSSRHETPALTINRNPPPMPPYVYRAAGQAQWVGRVTAAGAKRSEIPARFEMICGLRSPPPLWA
jgi:hypothetical protein